MKTGIQEFVPETSLDEFNRITQPTTYDGE